MMNRKREDNKGGISVDELERYQRAARIYENLFYLLGALIIFGVLFLYMPYYHQHVSPTRAWLDMARHWQSASTRFASTTTATTKANNQYSEPVITGPPAFKQEVEKALSLIKEKAPSHYQAICRYDKKIELSNKNDNPNATAWTSDSSSTIYFYAPAYNKYGNDIYFICVVLSHETAHQIQYESGQITLKEDQEHQALVAARDLLIKLGAPQSAIDRFASDKLLETKWWQTQ